MFTRPLPSLRKLSSTDVLIINNNNGHFEGPTGTGPPRLHMDTHAHTQTRAQSRAHTHTQTRAITHAHTHMRATGHICNNTYCSSNTVTDKKGNRRSQRRYNYCVAHNTPPATPPPPPSTHLSSRFLPPPILPLGMSKTHHNKFKTVAQNKVVSTSN